jgi:Alternative complex III, ActD subunit
MRNAIYGLFASPEAAQAASNNLASAGYDASEIVIVSSEPYEDFEFARQEQRSWIGWIAAAAGAVGAVLGYALTAGTQLAYPLRSGGMPIATGWTDIVITYEVTMLFAIAATVVSLLVSAKLPDRKFRDKIFDPGIWDGKILVGVAHKSDAAIESLKDRLLRAGADQIKQVSLAGKS